MIVLYVTILTKLHGHIESTLFFFIMRAGYMHWVYIYIYIFTPNQIHIQIIIIWVATC